MMKTSTNRRFFGFVVLLTLAIVVILHQDPRKTRFFDPHHDHCGQSEAAHNWAIHAVYGARLRTEGDYYKRQTVSTNQELPRDKKSVHKIMAVLAYLASKTKRAIRVNLSILKGYDREMYQPYSLVSADQLGNLGIELVEMGYWHRANQAQGMMGDPVKRNITLSNAPLQTLSNVVNDESVNEYLLNVDEILELDDAGLGLLMGGDMGYDVSSSRWLRSFACSHDEIEDVPPIPLQNDPLSP